MMKIDKAPVPLIVPSPAGYPQHPALGYLLNSNMLNTSVGGEGGDV